MWWAPQPQSALIWQANRNRRYCSYYRRIRPGADFPRSGYQKFPLARKLASNTEAYLLNLQRSQHHRIDCRRWVYVSVTHSQGSRFHEMDIPYPRDIGKSLKILTKNDTILLIRNSTNEVLHSVPLDEFAATTYLTRRLCWKLAFFTVSFQFEKYFEISYLKIMTKIFIPPK